MGDIVIIAAMSKNNVIGVDNTIPWTLPSDLKHFAKTTRGKVIVMGRNTWDSLGCKALPHRQHVVISSKTLQVRPEDEENVHHAASVEAAIAQAQILAMGDDVFVIGGQSIYEQAMPLATRLIITHVEQFVTGDTFFPTIDTSIWKVTLWHRPFEQELPYVIRDYYRI